MRYPSLQDALEVDVAVIGAGITGVTAAYLLAQHGTSVALVERGGVAHGATGYTTAKLTVGHAVIYRHLVESFGVEVARGYAASNQQALDWIAAVVEERGIDCDFERTANFVYTESAAHVQELEREAEAARAAGIEATTTTDTDLPFPVQAAVRVDAQAQFHPWKYAAALTAATAEAGGHVFEETRATNVRAGDSVRCRDACRIHPCGARDRRHAAALPRPRALLREDPPAEVVRGRGAGGRRSPGHVHQRRRARAVDPLDAGTRREAAPHRRRRRAQARRRAGHRRALRAARAVHGGALRRHRGRLPLVDARFRRPPTACRTSAGCGVATIASSSRPATRSGA